MTMGLTPRMSECLAYLKHERDHGRTPPTREQIKDVLRLRSKAGVQRLLNSLEERGLIRRMPNRARAIEIVEHRCPNCGFDPTEPPVPVLRTRALP